MLCSVFLSYEPELRVESARAGRWEPAGFFDLNNKFIMYKGLRFKVNNRCEADILHGGGKFPPSRRHPFHFSTSNGRVAHIESSFLQNQSVFEF